jgi:hypothetical protein
MPCVYSPLEMPLFPDIQAMLFWGRYTLHGGGDLSGKADETHSHEEQRMGHLASEIANSWADERASAMM